MPKSHDIVQKREKPVLPFQSLVENYDPNDEYTFYAQDYANEVFAENEQRAEAIPLQLSLF